MVTSYIMYIQIYRSTVGEHVVWETILKKILIEIEKERSDRCREQIYIQLSDEGAKRQIE